MAVTFAVLCTGQSLTPEAVESVRHLNCIAVSDAYKLCPTAIALCSQDSAWWRANPEARNFAGRKFSLNRFSGWIERPEQSLLSTDTNSGLLGVEVARQLGATRILLLGCDLHGTHYFGPHPKGFKVTSPQRFKVFEAQFARFARIFKSVEVINCSPDSRLECFPKMTLDAALCLN